MNPQGTYPQGEREDFQEWKERDLYYEAQASNKPRERKAMYKIVRYYYNDWRQSRTIESGLTLEQAQTHCGDPETSSSTCVTAKRKAYTRKVGEWFDGYTSE